MQKSITFSDDIHINYNNENKSKLKFAPKFAIGVIEFLTSSIYYSYGILFSEYVSYDFSYGEGLLSTVLFICAWSFADPFSRYMIKYLENNKYDYVRYGLCFSTLALFVGMLVPSSIIVYGLLGGVSSNVISTQLRFIVLEKYNADSKVLEGIIQIARALSLLIMPHFMLLLVTNYHINGVRLIFAAILLHIIPATFIIRVKSHKTTSNPNELLRYQTLPGRFSSHVTEMTEFRVDSSELDYSGSSSESSEEYDQDSDYVISQDFPNIHIVDDLETSNTMALQPSTLQTYYRSAGVSILPEIPEEDEEEDSDIDYINPKRVNRISIILEEINQRKESIKEIIDVSEWLKIEKQTEKIDKIEYIRDYKEARSNSNFFEELKSLSQIKKWCCFTPYMKYIWSRRLRTTKNVLLDNVLHPFFIALKNVYFYPILATKTTTDLVSTLYITLAPFLALKENSKQNFVFSTEDATFLLTYIAFAWCFFLVALPIVVNFSIGKIRVVFTFGLFVSATGLLLFYRRTANEMITISSLLFGFGYGTTSYTEKIVYREYIGGRPWNTIQGSLQISTAIIVIVIYHFLYIYNIDISTLLAVASLFYYTNAVFWILVPYLKYLISMMKSFWTQSSSHQHHNFLYS